MEPNTQDIESIKKNIHILALNILILSYENLLEDKEYDLDPESREFVITLIGIAQEMITELDQPKNQVTPRPIWNK